MVQEQVIDRADSSAPRRGWTKARAVLAGGLVLGVGAAVTLAAWTDQEWATGLFGSGTFGIEGSTDGAAFSEHPTQAAAAALSFQVDADKLSPGDAVYAGFSVQLIADSDYAADVVVAQDVSAAIANTTASYVYTATATCDETAFNAGTNANVNAFELDAPEEPVHLCFKVSAGANLQQGQTGSVTWQFTATSTDTL